MFSALNIEMLCEMERRRREEEYANPNRQAFQYESGGAIQTDKLIALLRKMKAEKASPKSGSQSIPAATFSSKTMVVKKVNKNE
jgi:hypothetical protein